MNHIRVILSASKINPKGTIIPQELIQVSNSEREIMWKANNSSCDTIISYKK